MRFRISNRAAWALTLFTLGIVLFDGLVRESWSSRVEDLEQQLAHAQNAVNEARAARRQWDRFLAENDKLAAELVALEPWFRGYDGEDLEAILRRIAAEDLAWSIEAISDPLTTDLFETRRYVVRTWTDDVRSIAALVEALHGELHNGAVTEVRLSTAPGADQELLLNVYSATAAWPGGTG